MKRILLILTVSVLPYLGFSQVGINTNSPNASSALDVTATDKGVLLPQIDLQSVDDASTITSPAASLLIWNTGATWGNAAYYYNSGTAVSPNWSKFQTSDDVSSFTEGDIKQGMQASDHNGWVILDGRAINTLTATQQTAATGLGFAGNLPDATDKVLMSRSGGALGNTGGNNSATLVQANLPNVNFIGVTSTAGAHSHDMTFRMWNTSAFNHNHNLNNGEFSERIGADDNATLNYSDNVKTTDTEPVHSHNVLVPSGGTGAAIDITPSYLQINTFIYLGE